MRRFLVEAYTGDTAGIADAEGRARRAAELLAGTGTPIRYVMTICVPVDEICFHLFDAPSLDTVRRVSDLAGLEPQRIVETVPSERVAV